MAGTRSLTDRLLHRFAQPCSLIWGAGHGCHQLFLCSSIDDLVVQGCQGLQSADRLSLFVDMSPPACMHTGLKLYSYNQLLPTYMVQVRKFGVLERHANTVLHMHSCMCMHCTVFLKNIYNYYIIYTRSFAVSSDQWFIIYRSISLECIFRIHIAAFVPFLIVAFSALTFSLASSFSILTRSFSIRSFFCSAVSFFLPFLPFLPFFPFDFLPFFFFFLTWRAWKVSGC